MHHLIWSQVPYAAVDTSYFHTKLIVPNGMRCDVLFTVGEIIVNANGFKAVSKLSPCGLLYLPNISSTDPSNSGNILITHNTSVPSKLLGNGGGATIFNIRKFNDAWIPKGPYFNIDFSPVKNTAYNSFILATHSGAIFISENADINVPVKTSKAVSNKDKAVSQVKRKEGLVEVDPVKRTATRRVDGLARIAIGGIAQMPDSITFYITDRDMPSLFYKYISGSSKLDSIGQLYFYTQTSNGERGFWTELPMHPDSLIRAKELALQRGATLFFNLRQMTLLDGKIYLAESGTDRFDASLQTCKNGKTAFHLNQFKVNEVTYSQPYGAILQFDPLLNNLRPYLLGGVSAEDSSLFFSNPDVISSSVFREKPFIVVHENISSVQQGRLSQPASVSKKIVNESYFVSVDDASQPELTRFMIAPPGAVVQGAAFTPDHQAMFINMDHGYITNSGPYHRGVTLALSGFSERLQKVKKPRQANSNR